MKNAKFDVPIILIYILLVFFGWISIYSSSFVAEKMSIFTLQTIVGKQLFFIFISALIGVFISLLEIKVFSRLAYIIYFLSIVSLILVLFIGKEVNGAKAWFNFGSFGIQPSEFAKLATILALAKFINDSKIYLNNIKNLIRASCFIIAPVLLIILQPDPGSALVYTSLIIMFYREGLQMRLILSIVLITLLTILTIIFNIKTSIILLIIMSLVLTFLLKKHSKKFIIGFIFFISFASIISIVNYGYEYILEPHQRERIDIIIGKEKNDLGSGYNLNQSLIAIGSGGFIGKGYLRGTQTKGNFIPEQNTDFIFCTVGEEWGFMGSLIIISLFIILIIRIIILSERQVSRFSRVIGYSLSSILFIHVIINIGMTIGLVPVIGIPLPFFSYGGSSMLAFSTMLFIFIKLNSIKNERF